MPALYDAIDGTWPALRLHEAGGWVLREGDGGGKRVSAATAAQLGDCPDIALAEQAMEAMGQERLFMLRPGEGSLDEKLAARGYEVIDPVTAYLAPVASLTDVPLPRVTAFTIWEPLAIMEEIWAAGGIGPARLRVMQRAAVKTGILSRWKEKPAGAAFAAIHDDICMVHAVEILPHQRRQGVAAWMMRAAGFWAAEMGATQIATLCTDANGPANALYKSLGFDVAGHYHYRIAKGEAN